MPSAEERRPAPLGLLALAFAAYSLAHLGNNTVLSRGTPGRVLFELQSASGGWIEPVLLRSQVVLGAFLLVIVALGRRSLSELGWRARDLVPGLKLYVGAWCALQLGLAAAAWRASGALAWHPMWSRFGAGAVLGGVLAQAFGHALVEDTAFRGFFLPQLRAHLARFGALRVTLLGTFVALVGSALLFGAAHLPTRLLVKSTGGMALVSEQWGFLSAGLALGLAYLVTRNLFSVIGLHVLLNDPAPLVDVPGTLLNRATLVVFAGTLAIAWLRRRRRERAAPEAAGADVRRAA
jgi:membrane protease YdiL (CAAX protease family)